MVGGRSRTYAAARGSGARGLTNGGLRAESSDTSTAGDAASSASGASVSGAGGLTHNNNVHVRFDVNASALSVDATGSVAVLAGRRGLHLVDLEAPFMPPSTLHHQTKLEVTVVKCNPHALFKSHVASSSNRNTLIWDIAGVGVGTGSSASIGEASSSGYKHSHGNGGKGGGNSGQTTPQPLVATLRAHTRPVSDVAWSPMEPSLLATCSADAKTLLWDMRSPQRPVQTLNAYNTSVLQVEWNRVDATSLATAHDGEVRVWDLRASGEKTVAPAALITAHMQKIYGLDWHPQRMYELVTCSEDKTVKFWDVMQPRVCQGTLTTGAPVWKAQYTPFGDGLVTISQRMDNTIRLWALSHGDVNHVGNVDSGDMDIAGTNASSSVTAELVHSFVGHGDLVKGMAWRVRPQTSVYQLVSWSKDQELRLWNVDVPQLEACGYDTASYLADAAPSEGVNTTTRQESTRRQMHAEFAEMHTHHSSYNLSTLKTDFVPLVVPKMAMPLSTDEYTFEGNDSSLQALLALEEELIKGGDVQPESTPEDDESSPGGDKGDTIAEEGDADAKERTSSSNGARALPCPRISGASFSGPNMLLVFDSRVAIGQSRSAAVVSSVAAGKESKPQVAPYKLPRTYEELLDLRDSRFATKKNKKPPVKLLSSTNMLGSMDVGANDWAAQQQQELIDGGVVVGVFGDDVDNHSVAPHGYRHSSMYYTSGSGGPGNEELVGGGVNEIDPSIHGGSEYLNTYFSSAEYHLPVNNPDHLLSMPPSVTPGLNLSPRASAVRSSTAERMKRMEHTAPALNLDLSISVTILDLSKLCGVSSILTYQTNTIPSSSSPFVSSPKANALIKRKRGQHGSMNRSMVSWMLRAAEDMSGKRGLSKNNLSRVLKGLLLDGDPASVDRRAEDDLLRVDESKSLAATCAQNAQVAQLAGRSDLQQIWSLLEISTAPVVELPIYKNSTHSSSISLCLRTSHPWSAHPLGKRLVHKILDMYEQAGDVQALASIVCALKPTERKDQQELRDSAAPLTKSTDDQLPVVREDRHSSITEMDSAASSTTGAPTSTTSSGLRSRRSSSNMLSQLTNNFADSNETPPVMQGTRRSTSHSEARSQGLGVEKDVSSLRASKDWPLPSGSSNGSADPSSLHSSPVREHSLPIANASGLPMISREAPPKAGGPSGWKMDFERLENPFKTWSGGASKEAPPPRLTTDTFQPPVQAVNGKSPATTMAVTASPTINSMSPSPLQTTLSREEEVDANDRVLLELSFRSVEEDKCLLSPEDEARYDIYKEAYADVLYRYGAMNLRNEVLKTMSHGSHDQRGISLGLICGSCNSKTTDPVCSNCHDFAVRCSVCQLVVRGQSMFCMTCGHGGHSAHLREWFEVETACPTGCGCWCKQATATMPSFQPEQQEADHTVPPSRSHSF